MKRLYPRALAATGDEGGLERPPVTREGTGGWRAALPEVAAALSHVRRRGGRQRRVKSEERVTLGPDEKRRRDGPHGNRLLWAEF